MKAFVFSDLHTSYKQLANMEDYIHDHPEIGAIIFAGDLLNMGEPVGFAQQFLGVLDRLNVTLLWVPGNNDFGMGFFRLKAKFPSLEGKIVEVNTSVISAKAGIQANSDGSLGTILKNTTGPEDDNIVKFTGVGGSPASWAGQYSGETMIDRKKIAGTIFVSHVPPPGAHNYQKFDNYSPTSKKLSDVPKVHICGHIHHTWGVAYLGTTKIVKLAPLESGFYAIMDLENLSVEFGQFKEPSKIKDVE